MTCLEHLIENCLVRMEQGKTYEEIMDHIRNDVNLENAGITPEQCWEICQYVHYSFYFVDRYAKLKDVEYMRMTQEFMPCSMHADLYYGGEHEQYYYALRDLENKIDSGELAFVEKR